MTLQKRTVLDRAEVLRNGDIQVREAIEVYDDETNEIEGEPRFRRYVVASDEPTPADVQAFLDNSKAS